MRNLKYIVFSISALLISLSARAQFLDITEQLENLNVNLVNPSNGYGSGISWYDFNNDGWDDLSIAGGFGHPRFLINNNGVLEDSGIEIFNFGNARISGLNWVDYDNDGHPDIFITKQNGMLELWKNDGNLNFTNVTAQAGIEQAVFIYANATWGDYNHDGYLDVFVTKNYSFFDEIDLDFTSILYKNNGDGTFTDVTEEAGLLMVPRPALQPCFVDLNNDGWEDLFIAVDRLPYPNELFINNQDGTFTRATQGSGVDNFLDAMSAAIGDYNQDGYLDVYVSNNPILPGNTLYRNNGDETFTNVAPDFGMQVMVSSWGSVWLDYNNDTWEDLYVSVMQFGPPPHAGSRFFVNNGGTSFTEMGDSLGINQFPAETFTVAKGDLNNDGYYDYATNNREPYFPRLFQNEGGTNNYLSVQLEGTIANRDGIGTWMHCYVGDQHLVRYATMGENLSGQNSRKHIFGLGQHQSVDSLILEWNSGTREVYNNVDVNQQLYLIEGASFLQPFEIEPLGDLFLCPGDSVVLDAGEHEEYLWSNGHTERYLTVSEAGTFTVEGFNEFGLSVESPPVEVTVAPLPGVDFTVTNVSCAGANDGSIEVSVSTGPVQSILWNTGDEEQIITNLGPGICSFEGLDFNGCPISGAASITEPSPLIAQATPSPVSCYGDNDGSISMQILGGTPPYSADWDGENPEAMPAGFYEGVVSDANGCEFPVSATINQPDSLWINLQATDASEVGGAGAASIEIFGGTPDYSITWSNGTNDVTSVSDLPQGDYEVTVTDANGCQTSVSFVISGPTSISENEQAALVLFPNPANYSTRLKGCVSGQVDIMIFDTSGRSLLHYESFPCNQDIPLRNMDAGTYLVRVVQGDRVETMKLILSSSSNSRR